MIKYLIEKEFKQLFRNSFLPKLIFIFPCMIMILMPSGCQSGDKEYQSQCRR